MSDDLTKKCAANPSKTTLERDVAFLVIDIDFLKKQVQMLKDENFSLKEGIFENKVKIYDLSRSIKYICLAIIVGLIPTTCKLITEFFG